MLNDLRALVHLAFQPTLWNYSLEQLINMPAVTLTSKEGRIHTQSLALKHQLEWFSVSYVKMKGNRKHNQEAPCDLLVRELGMFSVFFFFSQNLHWFTGHFLIKVIHSQDKKLKGRKKVVLLTLLSWLWSSLSTVRFLCGLPVIPCAVRGRVCVAVDMDVCTLLYSTQMMLHYKYSSIASFFPLNTI